MGQQRSVRWVVLALGLQTSSALAQGVSAKAPLASRQQPARSDGTLDGSSEQVRKLPGGITLHLAPGTVLESRPQTKLQLGPGAQTTTHVFQLVSGRVSVTVPKGPTPPPIAVLIRAPRRANAVFKSARGVILASNESVTIGAIQGEMLAALGDDWRPLSEGYARSFDARDPSGKRRQILPAAALAVTEPLVIAPFNSPASTRFSWGRVDGAGGYRIVVTAGAGPATRTLETKDPSARVDGLAPGTYHLSVSALDHYGLEGPPSTFSMKVLGVELPPGARQVGGGIELGPRQRIRLSDPSGIELSYGKATAFVRAPNEIGLSRGETTLVRLRESGQKGELMLRLTPRDKHADIAITPGTARWPRDPLSIKIAFRDGKGRPIPATPTVKTDVRVNSEVVPMSWVRHGSALEGALTPRSDKGPWVVRVQVKDEFGDEIGWGFLEVAGR
jgi:hypothetical protein